MHLYALFPVLHFFYKIISDACFISSNRFAVGLFYTSNWKCIFGLIFVIGSVQAMDCFLIKNRSTVSLTILLGDKVFLVLILRNLIERVPRVNKNKGVAKMAP